ncbi:MAG: beta-ketoacyl-ACP synthase [Cyanobacteriota bacterium]|nr:beta-ketoacyl-ACP synthase [Cyanobacteriota bacterium]
MKEKEVVVTGIGLLTALGALSESWQHLLAKESGIRLQQPFPQLPARPLALVGNQPSSFLSLLQRTVAATLRDANLEPPLSDCGVVIGSSRSSQGAWESFLRQSDGKLSNWLATLPGSGAIAAARQIESTGPVLAPMAACASGIWAIARAFELIQMGTCDRVLAGAVEAPITPLTLAGFQKMGALAETGCYPFDRGREGLVLGEGTALFILESADSARRRQAKIYGRILGFGLTADGYHVSAPSVAGRSAQIAVKQCLERSKLNVSDIDYIHAHGTSTSRGDGNEAQLIEYLFPQSVAISSTKGATGHTLGASGAIDMAFSLMALKEQILPPCIGLRDREFELDFVMRSRRANIENSLCFSFGFGGQNAVLALGRDRKDVRRSAGLQTRTTR